MKELESLDAAFVVDTFLAAPDRDRTQDRAGALPGGHQRHAEAAKRRVRKMLTTATAAALSLIPGGLLARLLRFSPGALGIATG